MDRIDRPVMAGRSVLVTGATPGTGRAPALGLTSLGAQLAMVRQGPPRTHQVAGEVSAAGGGSVEGMLLYVYGRVAAVGSETKGETISGTCAKRGWVPKLWVAVRVSRSVRVEGVKVVRREEDAYARRALCVYMYLVEISTVFC